MRVIEKNILREVEFGHNNQLQKHFSQRDFLQREGYNAWKYFLWGHNIFTKNVDSVDFSMCGYSSNTTKSRLNAFLNEYIPGCRISQKNLTQFLTLDKNTIEIDTCKKYRIDLKSHSIVEL